MRVLILNQFFYPDISATSQLMTDLAEDLQLAGLDVSALAGRESYIGGDRLSATEEYRGIHIRRVRCLRFERGSGLRRILSYLSFHVAAFLRLMTGTKQDVIVALTTPPLIAATARIAARLRGSKVVCLIQDLYPEVAVELGALPRRSAVTRVLHRISADVMSSADAVIVLGDCMRRRVEACGVRPEKVQVIPNWMDNKTVHPLAGDNAFAQEHGLCGKFVVLYSGNMGKAHDLDTILNAADRLRGLDDVQFVFIGDGPRRSDVERFIAEKKLSTARVLPYVARERLGEALGSAAVGLISQSSGLEGLIVPSKLYGLLATGVPCLFVGPADTEVARTIRDLECGFVVANGDAEGLADRILQLRQGPDLRASMAQRARDAFEKYFERRIVTRAYLDLLVKVASGRS